MLKKIKFKDEYRDLVFDELLSIFDKYIRFEVRKFKYSNPDDLTQIGYIALWEAWSKYDINRDLSIYTYAIPIIRFRLKDFFRKKDMDLLSIEEFEKDLLVEDSKIDFIPDNINLKTSIAMLNERQRDVLISRILFRVTCERLAEKYKISNKRISQIYISAIEKLRKVYQDD